MNITTYITELFIMSPLPSLFLGTKRAFNVDECIELVVNLVEHDDCGLFADVRYSNLDIVERAIEYHDKTRASGVTDKALVVWSVRYVLKVLLSKVTSYARFVELVSNLDTYEEKVVARSIDVVNATRNRKVKDTRLLKKTAVKAFWYGYDVVQLFLTEDLLTNEVKLQWLYKGNEGVRSGAVVKGERAIAYDLEFEVNRAIDELEF